MKKSVVLVIAVIYLLAVVIVGFVGLRMKIYNPVIYIDRIVCKSEGYTPCDPGKAEDEQLIEEGFDGYIHEKFTDGLTVRIECDYEPKSADRLKPLEFICAENDAYYTVEEQEDGKTFLIRFKKSGTCNVTVRAQDGKNAQLKIQVRALPSAEKFF